MKYAKNVMLNTPPTEAENIMKITYVDKDQAPKEFRRNWGAIFDKLLTDPTSVESVPVESMAEAKRLSYLFHCSTVNHLPDEFRLRTQSTHDALWVWLEPRKEISFGKKCLYPVCELDSKIQGLCAL